jgi:hypothetical protein
MNREEPLGVDVPQRSMTGSWDVRSASEEAAPPFVPHVDAEVSFDGLRRVYGALCAVAHVDGRITSAQREQLADYRDYLGLGEIEAEAIEEAARSSHELRVGKRPAELELVLPAMIELAAIGGRVSPDALRLITRVNEKARWPRTRINELIARALERVADRSSAPSGRGPFEADSFVERVEADDGLGIESSDEGELVLLAGDED